MNWRPTIRTRLTLLYGGLFLLAGVVLLGVTYRMVVHALPLTALENQIEQLQDRTGNDRQFRILEAQLQERKAALRVVRDRARWALVFVAVGAMTLGWFVAGRILKPIRTITEHARRASGENLGERIGLRGPPDELHDLANTIDSMLDRIESSYESQRQFSARVSHELRTPLSIMSAAVDSGDPDLAETVRESVDRSERLISALLAIARSEHGSLTLIELDLADIVGSCLERLAPLATRSGVRIEEVELGSARMRTEPVLLDQCIGNLIENACLYNIAGGWIRIETIASDGRAVFTIENSGPPVDRDEIASLLVPYQRGELMDAELTRGSGLGLAIVRSTVVALGASIEVDPGGQGGLRIVLSLPLVL